MNDPRPSPEALLKVAQREGRGQLKVFLGAAPGVGKTYEMLREGAARRDGGEDVIIGILETHGRREIAALTDGFETIPRRPVEYQGRTLDEMDLDAVLARHPALVLVDELAHSNAPGSRHSKRYQDVEELLEAGINVLSTLNIQHLESLNDVIASFSRVRVAETLPDSVLDDAEIEVVDIPPDELIQRLKDGKVYVPEEASRALGSFFSKSNLSALRELALRRAAQAIDTQMLDYLRQNGVDGAWAAGERILVAVSEQAGNDELVRAAKRTADAMHAPWTALHVETGRSARFSDDERGRIAASLQLARLLGGQVATVPATSVVEGLKRFASANRITQLIVGKSARSRWFEFINGSVVDRLVRETPGVTVHVLPVSAPFAGHPVVRSSRPSPDQRGSVAGYAVSLALVGLVTFAAATLFAYGNIANAGLLYLLPVLVSATRYGQRTGVVTGLASSLAYNFFFIPPTHTFTIEDPQNIVTVLVLLGVALAGSRMASRLRDQALIAERIARQNSALAGFARQLTPVREPMEVAAILCADAHRLLGISTAMLLPGEEGLSVAATQPPNARLETLEHAAALWAFDHRQTAGRGSGTLTASDWQFHPVLAGGAAIGVFGVSRLGSTDPVPPEEVPLLLSLIDQAALAMQRARLEEDMTALTRLEERDRLRAALLSSVSHDLRTPLTGVIGNLQAIQPLSTEQAVQLDAAKVEARRLDRFVANLLEIVRIEAGGFDRKTEPVDLVEAVSSAIHDVRALVADRPVRIAIAPDLPLVRLDPQLFHHCLINLIENAAKYGRAGSELLIKAVLQPGALVLEVIDEGPGIAQGQEERLFETFYRIEGSDRTGGTGLGLAIVKGFAEAMGLAVTAANRADGMGAVFSLTAPEALLVNPGTGDA